MCCIFVLVLGETFKILTNSSDMKMVNINRGERDRLVNEEACCLRGVTQVEDMKTLVGGFEFNDARICENAKYPLMVITVKGDVIFFES
jgi:hypothetical protein